jgi:hypothetical protein
MAFSALAVAAGICLYWAIFFENTGVHLSSASPLLALLGVVELLVAATGLLFMIVGALVFGVSTVMVAMSRDSIAQSTTSWVSAHFASKRVVVTQDNLVISPKRRHAKTT